MEDFITRILENLGYRVSGPMHFRIYLQPLVASLLGVIAGIRDAIVGNPRHLWTMLTNAERRGELFREGWRSIGRIFLLAMVLDIIYQLIVERFVYPLEVLITAVFLAIFPFLIVRAFVSHIVTIFIGRGRAKSYAKNSSK